MQFETLSTTCPVALRLPGLRLCRPDKRRHPAGDNNARRSQTRYSKCQLALPKHNLVTLTWATSAPSTAKKGVRHQSLPAWIIR